MAQYARLNFILVLVPISVLTEWDELNSDAVSTDIVVFKTKLLALICNNRTLRVQEDSKCWRNQPILVVPLMKNRTTIIGTTLHHSRSCTLGCALCFVICHASWYRLGLVTYGSLIVATWIFKLLEGPYESVSQLLK